MIPQSTIQSVLATYDANASLAEASTIPAPWYVDSRIAELEDQGSLQQDLADGRAH